MENETIHQPDIPQEKLDMARFVARYKPLFPLPNMDRGKILAIQESLKDINFHKPVLIHSTMDIMKHSFAYGLLSLGNYVDFDLYSATKLVDVWLGKVRIADGEHELSIGEIETKVVGVYLGFNELPNKSLVAPLEQLISDSMVRGRLRIEYPAGTRIPQAKGQAIWLFYKGHLPNLQNQYPSLYSQMMDGWFQVINPLSGFSPTSGTSSPLSNLSQEATVTDNEDVF